MKKTVLFIILTAILFITGCSTTGPCTPKQHPEKYVFQAIQIAVPMTDEKETRSSPLAPSDEIQELLKNPKAVLTEFPVVYSTVGETAVNDQTKTISAHETYEAKADTNGVIQIVYRDKAVKVGQYTSLTIKTVEKDDVCLDLWFYEKSLAGKQEFAVSPATETQESATASLPLFKRTEFKTSTPISIPLGLWFPMGGLIKNKDGKFSSELRLFIRILPPKKN